MSFKGEVEISAPQTGHLNKTKFNVLDCNYRFYMPSDNYGRITGRRVVGKINFIIETSPSTVQLANCLFVNAEVEGKFVFFNRDALSKMLELDFKNGRIIDMETVFSNNGDMPLINRLIVSAEKLTLTSEGNVAEDNNDWETRSEY